MSIQERHQDVAAYALGVLEPGDAYRFEDHLADCLFCALELSGLTAVAAAMASMNGSGGPMVEVSPRLLNRLTRDVALILRRGRRRRLALVAAAVALIVALPAAVVSVRGGQEPAVLGLQVTSTDARSGVTASAVVEDRAWGTAVAMRVSGLAGPGYCRLVVIGVDGVERPVLSWRVPAAGHATLASGRAEPLDIEGGTALPGELIGRWEIRDHEGVTLVTLGG
ncbi:hypothetical protein [Streptomyces albipurpureus]|uniref:Zinc-finger domain-containing protein n=1 Tax=Streptomyces albipurpureus TaxID=2897419 RepID=A0ABT0UM14_9ACTN|nr:hypothetical protein [Streptomyces sp. CWNU-1]MCM2389553.1 hypothetical protein [Streptomyces sp. CWNU-1]